MQSLKLIVYSNKNKKKLIKFAKKVELKQINKKFS